MSYTTVSCFIGDDAHLVELLRVLAVRKGTKVGQLVRKAIDQSWGEELNELRPIFFADDCLPIDNNAHENSNPDPAT